MHCDNAKDLWDKMINIYEGDAKVKGDKLQIFRAKFEQLKMTKDVDITSYLLQVIIKGMGVKLMTQWLFKMY
jgi:hypothetical protein